MGTSTVGDLVAAIRERLAAAGDPERAVAQQRYMKSALPYWGLSTGDVRREVRSVLAVMPPLDRRDWEAAIRTLWDQATHREEWYAALAIARRPAYRHFRDADALPLWRHLIVAGAWWDVVDETASHLVGPLLRSSDAGASDAGEGTGVRPVLIAWATCDNLWLRRTAILSNLGAGDRADVELLTYAIEANLEPRLQGTAFEREFFLRKAIGWALREHARTDPDWVRRFVADHADELSGLSRREALKHLG